MAKLSLPKLEFDKKKTGIAGGALLVAVAGWFAWDMFMAEPPPPPPPPPVAAMPPAPKPPVPAVTEKPAVGEKKGDATADAKPAPDGAPAAKPAGDATPANKPAAAVKMASAPDMTAPVDSGPRMLTARSKLDARECLKHETNQAIQQCAERFR